MYIFFDYEHLVFPHIALTIREMYTYRIYHHKHGLHS